MEGTATTPDSESSTTARDTFPMRVDGTTTTTEMVGTTTTAEVKSGTTATRPLPTLVDGTTTTREMEGTTTTAEASDVDPIEPSTTSSTSATAESSAWIQIAHAIKEWFAHEMSDRKRSFLGH